VKSDTLPVNIAFQLICLYEKDSAKRRQLYFNKYWFMYAEKDR